MRCVVLLFVYFICVFWQRMCVCVDPILVPAHAMSHLFPTHTHKIGKTLVPLIIFGCCCGDSITLPYQIRKVNKTFNGKLLINMIYNLCTISHARTHTHSKHKYSKTLEIRWADNVFKVLRVCVCVLDTNRWFKEPTSYKAVWWFSICQYLPFCLSENSYWSEKKVQRQWYCRQRIVFCLCECVCLYLHTS